MQLKTRLAIAALALLPLSAAANSIDYIPISGIGINFSAAHQQMMGVAYEICPEGTFVVLHEVTSNIHRDGYIVNALLSCQTESTGRQPGTKPGLAVGR